MNHELVARMSRSHFDPRVPDLVRRDQTSKKMAWSFVLDHPFDYAKLSLRRLWTTLLPFDPRGKQHWGERLLLGAYWLLVYPAATIGLICTLREHSGSQTNLLAWLIGLNLAAISAVLYWSDLRFRIGIDLLLGCFAGPLYARFLTKGNAQQQGVMQT